MRITAQDFLESLDSQKHVLIDVRSEGEFLKGRLPSATNIPILNNEHRHLVGLCYKERGQSEAIKLGHELVDPLKPTLQEQWRQAGEAGQIVVHCWRGGMRSSIACQWMRECGLQPLCIEGGYKAVRHLLLGSFEKKHAMLVLTGLTGSGKTQILKNLPSDHYIDLEHLANHRGSVFGKLPGAMPSQQTFENALAIELLKHQQQFLVEDESQSIAQLWVPGPFFNQMQASPLIVLECPLEERVEAVYREYIEESPEDLSTLEGNMRSNLRRIQRRLGGAKYQELDQLMFRGFDRGDKGEQSAKELHLRWISGLLVHYYDPMYQWRLEKAKARILFRGNRQEIHEFIRHHISRGID